MVIRLWDERSGRMPNMKVFAASLTPPLASYSQKQKASLDPDPGARNKISYDRSRNVYENKGTDDKVSGKKRTFSAIETPIRRHCGHKPNEETAQFAIEGSK